MPYQVRIPSYDASLNPTKATMARHAPRRTLFGKRCICGKPWRRDLGCEDRLPQVFAYLQDSTGAYRAYDLQHNRDLFTTFEADIILANDRRSRQRRAQAEKERRARQRKAERGAFVWQDSYPVLARPATWAAGSPTAAHEVSWQPALSQRQRQPAPYPMERVAA
jgi:hypothetical protein